MKTVSTILFILAASVAPALATGPTWDSSGDSQLNGTYYFRQVLYQAGAGGDASAFYAFYGNIVFSGTGTYSISVGSTFVEDTSEGSGSSVSTTATTGTYSVSASGFGFLSSPLVSGQNILVLVSNQVVIGSETESGNNDMFVAAPVATLTNSSFTGSYAMAGFFPGGSPATTASASYQLNPNGSGSLGTVSISGTTGAGGALSQNSSGIKYSFSNNANVITFPTNNSADFYSGQEYMYLSPDSNFVFGGSPTGFDMFVGVRNVSSGTSTQLSGLYYEAGFDSSEAAGLDSYYGSFNAFQGNIVGHERLLYSGYTPEGLTYYSNYPTSISGTYTDSSNTVNYAIGQDGIRVGAGTNGYPAIEVAFPYTPPSPAGAVYIDPTGIVNTASSAPYTAGVSPGDFITFYNGVNLASSTVFAPPGAFPTNGLGGVTVLIDGISAPLYYVSPTQVSALVPYEASTFPIASIQINNNGVLSNIATAYVNETTPGVFTSDPVGGIGYAAMLDFPSSGGYFIVGADNPANPGDNVAVYLTGLGTPFPTITDGALGPASGDYLVQTISVDVSGVSPATPPYIGLAPDLAGLYQINFTMPPLCTTSGETSCINAGDNSLGITGPDSYSDESIIPVDSGAGTAAVRTAQKATPAKTPAAARRTLPRFNRSSGR